MNTEEFKTLLNAVCVEKYFLLMKNVKILLEEYNLIEEYFGLMRDILHDAILSLLERDKIREIAKNKSHIYHLIRKQIRYIVVSKARRKETRRKYQEGIHDILVESSIINIEDSINTKLQIDNITPRINQLNTRNSSIVHYFLKGYSLAEIDRILNLKENTSAATFGRITEYIKDGHVSRQFTSTATHSERHTKDGKTKRIIELTKVGLTDVEISRMVDLDITKIRNRRSHYNKVQKVIKSQSTPS